MSPEQPSGPGPVVTRGIGSDSPENTEKRPKSALRGRKRPGNRQDIGSFASGSGVPHACVTRPKACVISMCDKA